MSTWLLGNAKSRRGKPWFDEAAQLLRASDVPIDHEYLVDSPAEITGLVQAAIAQGATRVLVGGGDGTLALVAQQLADTKVILGVLPFGTGNAFARDLGIQTDVAHAVSVIAAGESRAIDLGEINGELFLNVATLGLSVQIARGLTRPAKRHLGPLAYLLPTVRSVSEARPFEVTLTLPTETIRTEAYQVVIGNGRYHAGPFELAKGASLESGELIVYVVEAGNPQVLARYLLALAAGQHEHLPDVPTFATTRGEIVTRPVKRFIVDGELRTRTPAVFRSHPRALNVFCPAPS